MIKFFNKKFLKNIGYEVRKNQNLKSFKIIDDIYKSNINEDEPTIDVGANRGQSIEKGSRFLNHPKYLHLNQIQKFVMNYLQNIKIIKMFF